MRRIMIVGGPGSGKSTLAFRLQKQTGLPIIHMDKIYWSDGWILNSKEQIRSTVEKAAQKSHWIFEGNNSSSFDLRIENADTIIFLDLPTRTCLFRVLLRTIKNYGLVRKGMALGCPDRFDWSFLKLVYGYRKSGRLKALKLLEEAPTSVKKYHLENRRSVDIFLYSFKGIDPISIT
ncbi:MAG: AAA family ATPase [Pseudomonas marincola]